MHPFPRFVLALLLLFLCGHASHAQEYPVVKYTVREGLVQNQVLTLFKDSRGFVWCGTWYGLSKFNGETFENYTEAEGLWNGWVNDVIEDNEGYIWILGKGVLARFDGNEFKKYTIPEQNIGNIILNTHTNSIQIQTHSEGLWEVRGDTVLRRQLPNFPSEYLVTACYHSPSDTYFFQTDQKIISYRNGKVTAITGSGGWSIMGVIQNDVHLGRILQNGNTEYYIIKNGNPTLFLTIERNITVKQTLPYRVYFSFVMLPFCTCEPRFPIVR